MPTTSKGRKTTASKASSASKTTTRKKTASKSTAPKATATKSSAKPGPTVKAKKAAAAKKAAGTRTSSRSAKRRSPKEGQTEDPAQIELERTEFLRAMDKYKRKTGKTFPTWTEVLEVLRGIGWLHPLKVQQQIDEQQLGKPKR